MDLRLTVAVPDRVGALTDVVVTATPGTPLRCVLPELLTLVGRPDHTLGIHCGGTELDPSHPLGTPPLVQGAVLVCGPTTPRTPALLEAHVVAGPQAGSVVPLPVGTSSVGRSSSSTIIVDDARVSRRHATVEVRPGSIEIVDGGSTNGTEVDGERVTDRMVVEPGQEISFGAGIVVIGRVARPPASTAPDGAGVVRVNRRPDLRPARPGGEISFPAEPSGRPPGRLPWPTLVLPLLLAVPMALFWHQAFFLMFALMSPVLMLGQWFYDRRSGRHEQAELHQRWQTETARTQQALDEAVALDRRRLHELRPDLAELAVTAAGPTDDLWRRSPPDPEFLTLRIGRGPEAGGLTVRRCGAAAPEAVIHPDVPLVVDLPAVTVLGIAGPRWAVLSLARSLVGQIAVLHSPADVALRLLVAVEAHRRDWQWLGRLPHATTETGRTVVVLDEAHLLRRHPTVADLFTNSLVICLVTNEQQLPVECGATIVLGETTTPPGLGEESPFDQTGTPPGPGDGSLLDGSAILRRPGDEPLTFAPDLPVARWAERLSRALAPLRDGSGGGHELPDDVRLIDLLRADDLDPTQAGQLARHWRRPGRRGPTAVLGVSAHGPHRIDLGRDGPHVLLGGTTGAGKSELLQTMVAALAVDSAPDEISFLLIDYKGGAAFRECAALPHVTGLITDLDPHLAGRALTALSAELRHRERLLHGAGAVDLDDYRARPGRLVALPRLVVVVDEFRVLAEELPDFVSGLVRVATVGRSLGVHLVLATQRPTGIVSADISSNTNLRIALRMRDDGDSRDLIDDPAAAALPVHRPGRAIARVGSEPLTIFHAARLRGHGASEKPSVRVAEPLTFAVDPPADQSITGPRDRVDLADLPDIAESACRAAELLGLEPLAAPWLPPLPEVLTEPAPGAFALKDVPEQQSQVPLTWALTGSQLAVAGGPRSGRTTALAAITGSLSVDEHVYVIDGSGALAGLTAWPHVDAVVAVNDLERCERLLRRLGSIIEQRQKLPARPARSDVVVLIDGWEALTANWAALDHGRLTDELLAVLAEGPGVGLQAAITGGRTLLTGSVSSLLAERLVLRFADPTDALLGGVRADLISRSAKPGRGVHLGPGDPEGHEVQVVMRPPPPQGQSEARPAWAVPALPTTLEYEALYCALPNPAAQTRLGTGGDRPAETTRDRPVKIIGDRPETISGIPVGIGGDLGQVITLGSEPITLVLGHAGSGRSSALLVIAEGLHRQEVPVIAVNGTDWPAGIPVISDRDDRAVVQLEQFLRSHPSTPVTVLVDELRPPSPLGDSPADLIGEWLVGHVHEKRAHVVLACSPSDLLTGFRGLAAAAREARQGLLVGDLGPADGEVFGLRVSSVRRPPGRAILVRRGKTTTVQLARPPRRELTARA